MNPTAEHRRNESIIIKMEEEMRTLRHKSARNVRRIRDKYKAKLKDLK